MGPLVFLTTAVVAVCLAAAWLRSAGGQRARRDRLRQLGWGAAFLAVALSGFGLTGSNHWPPLLALTMAGAVAVFAPAGARRLLPWALLGLGLYGFVLAARYAHGDTGQVQFGAVLAGAGSWRTHLVLLQAYVFIAAGVWLLWRSLDRHSRLAHRLLGRPRAGDRPAPGRTRWGILLVPVAGLANELLGVNAVSWWYFPLTAAVIALALAVVILAPAVASDMAAAGLMAIGGYGIALAAFWPALIATPPGYAPAAMYGALLVDSRALAGLAGVQGLLLFAFGAWLTPRTLGARAWAMLGGEPDAALASRVRQLTETRTVAVDSASAELRRIERDLHDGAQARLVALGMSLRAVERLIESSPQAALALVTEARETSSRALSDLRDLVRGIYPPVLADRGLADAVRALALDAPVRTEVDIELAGRPDAPVESACYFAVAEALANAVKHASATFVQVSIRHTGRRRGDGVLRIEVTDDGTGGADPAHGTGLAGLERRLATFDGILAVSSPPGGPTMIVMEVPCALSSRRTSSC